MPSQQRDAKTVFMRERGKGIPLVLIHGFPVDSRMWNGQIDALADRARVIAVDLPGFGQSPSEEPFTIESAADGLHELLSGRDALPCILAGLSMGGYIALAYANRHPGDLRGLILIDTKAAADTDEQKQTRDRMIELTRTSGAKAVAERMLPKMLAEDSPRNRPAVARALREMMESCPPLTIEHALAAMRDRPDRTEELAAIRVPTLLIFGDGDSITPVSVGRQMRERIPDAEPAVIRGAGHMSPMEQPAQVNRAIDRFLRKIAN